MPSSDNFKVKIANAIKTEGAIISLHSANPGTTGGSEISGGGYARQTTSWPNAAMNAGAAVTTGSQVTFTVAANTTVTHFGVRDGAGNYLWGDAISPSVTLTGAPGTIVLQPVLRYTHP